ncbi:hypothetical protein RRU01S_04_01460 [Agrobacterium rubi TR3 = NBRC 13261]|uniref:Uncharacterized protein n=1 Tax=Agrobacterium rubi TR3 = NBRC 13261 TaxID=1368415 RepID=A0A081CRM8_9HYPH|nr:hypothetical protein [Agrobacterium rubi]MBP1876867.1 hypothetical protein [Agrobacterium rubi]GAK69324.1 hypothetical protein RRU01S_04_01460 [Agrobacterium rubi TR3 = NBRC 13261]
MDNANTTNKQWSTALYIILGIMLFGTVIAFADISRGQLILMLAVLFGCMGTLAFMVKKFNPYAFAIAEMAIACGLAWLAFLDRVDLKDNYDFFRSAPSAIISLKILGAVYAFAKALESIGKGLDEAIKDAEKSGDLKKLATAKKNKQLFEKIAFKVPVDSVEQK